MFIVFGLLFFLNKIRNVLDNPNESLVFAVFI